MHVAVDGARLYVDIEGSALVPDGAAMREKPTLLLLHGGPGFDHTGFKPAFSALSDVAQVVYYDHRGNGRSTGDDPSEWNLARWGDDVKALCDALGIVKPIVCGQSFGGFVALSYATRHPGHAGKLVLMSTAARVAFDAIYETFERLGGPEIRQVAEAYWSRPTPEGRARYIATCVPFYRRRAGTSEAFARAIMRAEVAVHFNGPANEHGRFDFREGLGRIACPVLVMAGEDDPIAPIVFSEAIAAALPPERMRFERFAGCRHILHEDDPERTFAVLRDFIAAG